MWLIYIIMNYGHTLNSILNTNGSMETRMEIALQLVIQLNS